MLAAVPGSPMSPSTKATFAAAAKGFSLVMCREFATMLYPRFRNASTSPAPIPREAPVIIAVLLVFGIYRAPYLTSPHRLWNRRCAHNLITLHIGDRLVRISAEWS